MKKILRLLLVPILFVSSLAGCSNKGDAPISFSQSEYEVHSGDKVTIEQKKSGVTYSFLNLTVEGIDLNEKTGEITYSNVPNLTQVLYTATLGKSQADPVVLTLLSEVEVPTLSFVDISDYICDGNIIYATSSTNSSIAYSIKERVSGVSINRTTGQVKLTEAAVEGSQFVVVISSNGATLERTFTVAKTNLVKAINDKQLTEVKNKTALCFNLDYSECDLDGKEVKCLISSRHVFGPETFVFDASKERLTVKKEALENFSLGENVLTIVTNKNMINVTVIVANKIVKTAEDIARINDSRENLSGYYVLGNDIDLGEYITTHEEEGKGWTPVGIYHDVTDGTAFNDTFKGTFDGNGHIISGYRLNRRDEFGFNAGLFGYVYNLATIKNLGMVSDNDNTTASFAGAIAGFNEGKIINCWTNVNVSNNYGGTDYRITGGFVGRNSGTIEGCYSIGVIDGESQVGAFVGLNEGTIRNCYSTKESYGVFTTGQDPVDCILFESKEDLIAHKNEMVLDETYWDMSGDSYPVIKSELVFYYPYSLDLQIEETEIVKGTTIPYSVKIYPEALEAEYMPKVQIISDDSNTVISDGNIVSSASSASSVNVKAVIDDNGLYLEDVVPLHFFNQTSSVKIDNVFLNNRVEPGENYKLSAVVSPAGANQNVRWSLSRNIKGITIVDNELRVGEAAANEAVPTFNLIATSSGVSDSLELTISIPNYLSIPLQVVYADDNKDISYDLGNVNLSNAKLYIGNEEINFTQSGSVITISREVIKARPDTDVGFKLLLNNGDIYRLYATYISHNRFLINNLPADAISLSSVEDFKTYFNVKDYNPLRYQNYYDKTFYLTNDIDFKGEEIYGIGYENDESAEYRSFTGKIYGFGHTIKNAVIKENEKYLTLTTSQKDDNYRPSKYGVGFFGSFSGCAYDIVFDNISVTANSWNGCFAGMIGGISVIENVSFINSSVKNAEGADYSTGGLTTGRFAAKCDGKMLGCSYNGSILGLLGA